MDVAAILPHRPPFLLLDAVDDLDSPRSGNGVWRPAAGLAKQELYHLDLLLVEFAAQTAAYVAMHTRYQRQPSQASLGYLVGLRRIAISGSSDPSRSYTAAVTLKSCYKNLYKYHFRIPRRMTGELEFIVAL